MKNLSKKGVKEMVKLTGTNRFPFEKVKCDQCKKGYLIPNADKFKYEDVYSCTICDHYISTSQKDVLYRLKVRELDSTINKIEEHFHLDLFED